MSWWLLTFARNGPARYLSHLDTARLVQRTFARAGLQLAVSQGERPKPRLSLPLPLPVGAAATAELAVLEMPDEKAADEGALRALAAAAPPGFEPLDVVDVGERRPRPQAQSAQYTCALDGDEGVVSAAVERYNKAETVIIERVGPKGRRRLDLKKYVGGVIALPSDDGVLLDFAIRYRSDGAARPQEVIDLIASWAQVEPVMRRLERLGITWRDELPGAAARRRKESST
jgi:radical SAM-linked protein